MKETTAYTKARMANMEALRVLAMLMIISLHYLDKGEVLPKPTAAATGRGTLAWLIEALCVPAVNVYVLISAYFLCGREYEPQRAVKLWLKVMFYSLGIPVVVAIINLIRGVTPVLGVDKYTLLHFIMPITQEHYWFITAYIIMVLLAPLMNKALRELPEPVFRKGLIYILVISSLCKTILPIKLPGDRLGYDALWFICLYLVATYLKYHVIRKSDFVTRVSESADSSQNDDPVQKTGNKSQAFSSAMRRGSWFMIYLFAGITIFLSYFVLNAFYLKTGLLEGFINRQYNYNSLFCLIASVGLFLCFTGTDPDPQGGQTPISKGDRPLKNLVLKAGSTSLAVYLIHEHELLRYVWPEVFKVKAGFNSPLFLMHWIFTIVAVYALCSLVDIVRDKIYKSFTNKLKK